MRKNVVIAVLGLLVGLGAGYGVGVSRHRSADQGSGATAPVDEVAMARGVVLAALRSGSYGSMSNKVAENLLLWSKAAPRAALAALSGAERVPQRNKMLAFPLTELARQDVGAATNWLRTNLQEPDRSEVADRIVSTLRRDAPRAAVALLLESDLNVDGAVFPYALGALAKIDPTAAIDSWQKLKGERSRFALVHIAEGYVANNPEAALRWCGSLRGTEHEKDAVRGILHGLIETQPGKVKDAVEQLGLTHAALVAAVDGMAYRAPEGVIAVLGSLESAEATEATRKVVRALMNSSPARALAVARERMSLSEGNEVLTKAWKTWREFDPKAARDWAHSVTDLELKHALQQIERMDAAKYQPETVLAEQAALPLEQIHPHQIGRALSNAPETVARQWIEAHPDRVDSELTRLIAMNSAPDDADGTIAWAKRLPERLRDSALHGTASGLVMHGQLERAAEVAGTISNTDYRTGLCFSLFAVMMHKDQQQAYEWLEKQPLPPEIRDNWKLIVRESMAAEIVPFFD